MSGLIKEWQWAEGAWMAGKAADIGPVLERLQNEKGELRPEDVVLEAADPKSPLHGCFEWDDRAAAAEHRLQQARRLIRSVEVVFTPAEGKRIEMSAYVHVGGKGGDPRYITSAVLSADADLLQEALAEVTSLLHGIQRRYGHLQQLAGLFKQVEDAVKAAAASAGVSRAPRRRRAADVFTGAVAAL